MVTIHPMAKSPEVYKENTFLLYGNMKCLALMIATSNYCRYAVAGPEKKPDRDRSKGPEHCQSSSMIWSVGCPHDQGLIISPKVSPSLLLGCHHGSQKQKCLSCPASFSIV
jgi:hypothetical protein